MKFVITESEKWTDGDLFTASEPYTEFDWQFLRNDGGAVCESAGGFASEREARSDIAAAKTSMKAARFAKVENA